MQVSFNVGKPYCTLISNHHKLSMPHTHKKRSRQNVGFLYHELKSIRFLDNKIERCSLALCLWILDSNLNIEFNWLLLHKLTCIIYSDYTISIVD